MTDPVDMDGLTDDTYEAWGVFAQAALDQLGFELVPRSARRTCAQQAVQWAIGRSGPNDARTPTTHAEGCRSWHVEGRAVDFNIFVNGVQSRSPDDYVAAGELAESLGWIWGGRFPGFGPYGDAGHVEWHPGMKIEDVCPNPAACVDVPASAHVAKASTSGLGLVGLVLLAGALLGGAAGVGIAVAQKERR